MNAATLTYRRQTLAVREQTYRDLLRLWPAFNPSDPRAWLIGASAVVRRDRARFALLARQYLTAHAMVEGTAAPRAAQPVPLPREQVDTSLRVTSLGAYAVARRAGKQPAEARDIASVRSSGAATRLALNGGRSVIQMTARTGAIKGWRRVGTPQCQLCKTLLGRFYPPSTEAFQCHDHCACTFEPVYG
jgi:hypothetical protein